MSAYLWKSYFENDFENFQQLLANATFITTPSAKSNHAGKAGNSGAIGSPGTTLATSPNISSKFKKPHGWNFSGPSSFAAGAKPVTGATLTRADLNWRDSKGITLLHYIASSADENASQYARALLQAPLLDLFIQDAESGWTPLHRALYFGNITIARALINRNVQDIVAHSSLGVVQITSGLIKIKDREGNSPFDVYNSSITNRIIRRASVTPLLPGTPEEDETEMALGMSGDDESTGEAREIVPIINVDGDELFAFGSNKNFTLGFGDEDDRQYPERITLNRPDHLLQRFYSEHQARITKVNGFSPLQHSKPSKTPCSLPAVIQYRPIIIQDVQMSKLHSAILTTDPEANLYTCGFGPGGRLGTGDETTRFLFVSICGGGLMHKKVIHVGLGQNHTVAISSQGEVFTWGSNSVGQLGYTSPTPKLDDDEPRQLLPRQVFGTVKREIVIGAAASRIHTVLHTSISLFTFGKNEGQLGLVDSDARSLVIQNTPRKVAAALFSSPIIAVSAIDKATSCLLENHEVWVFANYGYTRMSFPLESLSNFPLKSSFSATRYRSNENSICKITSGGDTICVMSVMGDVFTVNVNPKVQADVSTTSSTTNPSKIRGALSNPQRIWSLRKDHMAVRDVAVGEDGSIIICTDSGSVWRRVKRAKVKDANAPGTTEYKPKDYKFSRIGRLTGIKAVRSSTFGAYAAIRKDCDVLKTQLEVDGKQLWRDLHPLLPFKRLAPNEEDSDTEMPSLRFWIPRPSTNDTATIRQAVLTLPNLEERLMTTLKEEEAIKRSSHELRVATSTSDVAIPVHEFILSGRSAFLRRSLNIFRQNYFFRIPEVMTIEYDKEGKALISFLEVDLITILNFVLYIYTDTVVDVWRNTRQAPGLASRYRQIRSELMSIAYHLEMPALEHAVRHMAEPSKTLDKDMEHAIRQSDYFHTGDVEIILDGTSVRVHSALICQRCPFFEGLFNGRAEGQWLSSRREHIQEPREVIKVDLKHVDAETFQFVLRYLYTDSEDEIFDNVVAADSDTFLDLILDVISVANELMLDRLQQCCQRMLGRFVNIRNVCTLLNAVAACSVTEFKDAALEYICLNLEGMLENHYLNELDEDLIHDLDLVVRQNQLACLPFAKSGRAEAELFEMYPELPDIIKSNRLAQIDSMALRFRQQDDDLRPRDFSKTGTENSPQSSLAHKALHGPYKERVMDSKSPLLKPRSSMIDLMFEMDEGMGSVEPTLHDTIIMERGQQHQNDEDQGHLSTLHTDGSFLGSQNMASLISSSENVAISTNSFSFDDKLSHDSEGIFRQSDALHLNTTKPWGSTAIGSSKLDMKEIMAQTSSNRVSNISSGLSLQNHNTGMATGSPARLSQRERKKQQQQSHLQQPRLDALPAVVSPIAPTEVPTSPWQVASSGPKVSLKDVLKSEPQNLPRSSSNPPLTMRQTVPGNLTAAQNSFSEGEPSQLAQANSSISNPTISRTAGSNQQSPSHSSSRSASATYMASSSSSTPVRSIRHQPLPVQPSLQLSMADILSLQQTEKDIIKEAAAKRSLQEIQEEQAFQEWWDQESRKVMLEEAAAAKSPHNSKEGGGDRGKGRGGGRGGRGRGRGRGRRRGRGGERGQVRGD